VEEKHVVLLLHPVADGEYLSTEYNQSADEALQASTHPVRGRIAVRIERAFRITDKAHDLRNDVLKERYTLYSHIQNPIEKKHVTATGDWQAVLITKNMT
jgi:hypothetical protein